MENNIEAYVIKVLVDNEEKFATRSGAMTGTLRTIPGALAFYDLTDAVTELQKSFREKYRGDVWLDKIVLQRYYYIEDNKIVFDEAIFSALKVA